MRKDPYAKERAGYKSGKADNTPMEKFFANLIADAKGKDGNTPVKGKDYFTDKDKEALIKEVVSRIPKPKDGEDTDYDIVFNYVVQEVEKVVSKQVAKIPKAKDGKPGKDAVVDISAIVASLLKAMPKLEVEGVDYGGIKEYIDKQVTKIKLPPQRQGKIGGGASSLGQLTDVILTGVARDARGNYILGGGSSLTIEDEGTPLPQRSDLNFVGAGVTATDVGGKTVVTIPGGSGVTVETPTGTVNAVNQSFTVTATPKWIVSDGVVMFSGAGYSIAGLTVTIDLAPNFYIRAII